MGGGGKENWRDTDAGRNKVMQGGQTRVRERVCDAGRDKVREGGGREWERMRVGEKESGRDSV